MGGKASPVEEQIIRIGERISRLRKQAGLSLRELADLTGVSFTTIQKIESNAIIPSVASVMKIAQGLGRSVSFFLDEETEIPGEIRRVRREDRSVTEVPASRLRVEDVALDLRNSLLQATLLTVAPGGVSGDEPLLHPGEEIKLCLKGQLEYRVGGETYLVEEGDCLHFKSDIPHFWKNPGEEEAVVLSVCTPPPFFTSSHLSARMERSSSDELDKNGQKGRSKPHGKPRGSKRTSPKQVASKRRTKKVDA
jgi:transcriptional regulator with XRE-family HTH domain